MNHSSPNSTRGPPDPQLLLIPLVISWCLSLGRRVRKRVLANEDEGRIQTPSVVLSLREEGRSDPTVGSKDDYLTGSFGGIKQC